MSPINHTSRRPAPRARTVLVTGLPGFVALRLLWRLLADEPDTQVIGVVRPDLMPRAEAELARRVGMRARVRLFAGDVVASDLGLSPADTRHVCERVTDIFHLASIYHLGVAKERAEEVNIIGTRNVLALADRMPLLVRMMHYSSAFVAGDREGVILEDELERGQKFRSTFERTKFTAELEVRRAMQRLPISIVRPSLLVGDSRTGEIDRFDGPYFLIQLIVNNPTRLPVPVPSASNYPLNLVPVDYVVDAMHAISLVPWARGRTFHLVDPNPIAARDALRMIAEHAQRSAPRGSLPSWLARRLMELPVVEQLTRSNRAFLHELDSLTFFNSMNTLSALEYTQVQCPPFPDYVERLVSYVRQRDERWSSEGDSDGLL